MRRRLSFTHLIKVYGVSTDVFERWLSLLNGCLEIFNTGTAVDDHCKDLFVWITQDPAPQLDLVGLGHFPWGGELTICVDECVEVNLSCPDDV